MRAHHDEARALALRGTQDLLVGCPGPAESAHPEAVLAKVVHASRDLRFRGRMRVVRLFGPGHGHGADMQQDELRPEPSRQLLAMSEGIQRAERKVRRDEDALDGPRRRSVAVRSDEFPRELFEDVLLSRLHRPALTNAKCISDATAERPRKLRPSCRWSLKDENETGDRSR